MTRFIKTFLARRRLAKWCKANRESFELERYRRNRAAQLARRG